LFSSPKVAWHYATVGKLLGERHLLYYEPAWNNLVVKIAKSQNWKFVHCENIILMISELIFCVHERACLNLWYLNEETNWVPLFLWNCHMLNSGISKLNFIIYLNVVISTFLKSNTNCILLPFAPILFLS